MISLTDSCQVLTFTRQGKVIAEKILLYPYNSILCILKTPNR